MVLGNKMEVPVGSPLDSIVLFDDHKKHVFVNESFFEDKLKLKKLKERMKFGEFLIETSYPPYSIWKRCYYETRDIHASTDIPAYTLMSWNGDTRTVFMGSKMCCNNNKRTEVDWLLGEMKGVCESCAIIERHDRKVGLIKQII